MFDSPLSVLVLVIALGMACLLGFVLGSLRGRRSADGMRERERRAADAELRVAHDEEARLNVLVAQLRTRCEGLEHQLAYVRSLLAQEQQAERDRLDRDRERMQTDAERRGQEQKATLEEQSKVLAALTPVQKTLEELRCRVTDMEEGRRQEMGTLGERLRGLGEQQTRLDRQTAALSAALSDNRVRGAWGETQLRNVVESAGLLEHVDFDVQAVVEDATGRTLRPDMVVHLPGGRSIPVDAKTPYADYQKACAIPDAAPPADIARRGRLLQAHARALREHVRALGDKAYWNALDSAPDLVVAFIPNEALLRSALDADPTLLDDAFAHNVALASPVTLWAILRSVSYAWQQQSLSEDARRLFDLSRELYGRFAVLGARASALGAAITRTVTAYNQFAASLESRVLVTARRLQKLDASTTIAPVEPLDSDSADIRELIAPETQGAETQGAESQGAEIRGTETRRSERQK